MGRQERRLLATACLSHGTIHVYELMTPALLLLIQAEFGAGDFQMGNIVTLYGLCFGLGALPSGWMVDRLGAQPLLLICLWGASFSVLGMAAAPSLAWFAAAAALMGLCLSIYHPSGTALITHSLPLSGRVFAWHGMIGNLGVSLASVLAGTLGALLGWRWAYGLMALPGLVLGVSVLRLPSPSLHEIRRQHGQGRWLPFLALLVAAAFMGMVYRGMTTFLPKFFALQYAHSPQTGSALGGALTTLALMVGVAGMYLAGHLADRGISRDRIFLAGALLQMPFLAAMSRWTGPVLVPMAMAVAFFHFITQPVANHMVADFTPPRLRGLGFGLYFLTAFGAGSVGSSIGGWMSERYGLASAFGVMALLLVPASLSLVLLRRNLAPASSVRVETATPA